MPTPPPQIRAISDHVYFYLDRTSPLWPEFSTASAIGMHFSGDWPELQLELWAIMEATAMSDGGSPFDPFGRSDRTIIRPNPAAAAGPRRRRPRPQPARRSAAAGAAARRPRTSALGHRRRPPRRRAPQAPRPTRRRGGRAPRATS